MADPKNNPRTDAKRSCQAADGSDHGWAEVCIGGVKDRGNVVHLSQIPTIVRDHFGGVVYRSYFTGSEAFRRHCRQYGSPSGYQGKMAVPRLVWDIDGDKSDAGVAQALQDARDFVRSLKAHDVPEGSILPWFSGRRGFHIETPDLFGFRIRKATPEQVRKTMEGFWPAVDPKPLKRNGLIRARWSAHEESEYFKVPITVGELMKYDANEICILAKNPNKHETERKEAWAYMVDEYESCGPVLMDHLQEVEEKEITATNDSGINRKSDDPSNKITCMHKLWNRGPTEGRRNQDIHEMVRAWRSQGMGSEQCIAMAYAWVKPHNRTADHPVEKSEVEDIVHKVFARGYTPSCSREVYQEFCDPACIFYDAQDFGPKSTSLEEEVTGYLDRKDNGEQQIFNVNEVYPGLNFSVRGGEVVCLYGDTGLGKTSLFQNWTVKLTDPKKRETPLRVLFNSPEMGQDSMIDRFLQIQYGLAVNEGEQVDQITQARKQGWLNGDRVRRAVHGIHMSTEALSTQELFDAITATDPDVVVIDPLEDVSVVGGGYDRVADQSELIKELQSIGSKTNTAILVVHHINKAGMGKDRLELSDGKGSSAIPQKSDFTLAFEGERMGDERRVRTLKKRRNQSLNFRLQGDVDTFRFHRVEDNPNQTNMAFGAAEDVARERGTIPGDGMGGDSEAVDADDVGVTPSGEAALETTEDGTLEGLKDDDALR